MYLNEGVPVQILQQVLQGFFQAKVRKMVLSKLRMSEFFLV